MTEQIKVLSDSMIHKISAGEVIERPLSIVKELVENSIDAHSSLITVEIKNGGINFIRVTDDGIGIPKQQVETAFMNHATSKIKQLDDFENLSTLGFRGEALCTIAAVSQTEMVTKTQSENLGTAIKIHGGEIIEQRQVASNCGTTVISQNIFYNTPARLKFLKKASVEANYISNMMNHFALSNPQIAFKFVNNGKIIFSTNGNGDLKTALLYIMGKDIARNVLDIKSENKKFFLSGFVAKPEFSRNSRIHQNFFINGRYIKNKLVESAIENAYQSRTMVGKFPVYVLNLHVKPSFVDVNVHPSKLEIRFADEDLIYDFVFNAIRDVLKDKLLIPEYKATDDNILGSEHFSAESESVFAEARAPFKNSVAMDYEEVHKPVIKKGQPLQYLGIENKTDKGLSTTTSNKSKTTAFVPYNKNNFLQQTSLEQEKNYDVNYKIIGCIFGTYWLIEREENIYVMDQHAAHERILFEQLVDQKKSKQIAQQQLLTPIIFGLTEYENKILTDNIEQIKNNGFNIEQTYDGNFLIKSVPQGFERYVSKDFFVDMIDKLSNKEKFSLDEDYIVQMMQEACKKAIKAKDNLSYAEVEELIKKIMSSENPFNCPHGRPTLIKISKYEIEKLFGRKK